MVQDWLHVPWVQYGLAPFIAGLVVAELFNRLRLSGLALIAGLAATYYASARAAPTLTPVTSHDRIVLIALGATVLGLIFDLAPKMRHPVAAAVALCAGVLVVWATWPAVTLATWVVVLAPAGLGILYAVWTAGTLTLLADFPERTSAAGIGLGAAVGACALLAGEARLAALAFSAAAASGAYLLIQIVSNERMQCGTTFALPLAAICALIPPIAVLHSGLSWYLLPALALISGAALIPLSEFLTPRIRGLLALTIAAAAGAAVSATAWIAIGPPVK
jgi:hypothetical protein